MDQTSRTVRALYDALEARDWESVGALLGDGVVYAAPQTRERVTGRDAYLAYNQAYPGDWHLAIHRLVADGTQAMVWVHGRVGEEFMHNLVVIDLAADGLVERITDFWPQEYEPPAGRPTSPA